MITIIFEAHGTTFDNEQELSSGHNDVDLSPLGIQQSHELGKRYRKTYLDGVFCSDLQRSYKTASFAFEGRFIPIYIDKRLRECDYGKLTRSPADKVKAQRGDRVAAPFPSGESYQQTCTRMKSFLDDIAQRYQDGTTIMIIGHRATQYGLEHWLKNKPINEVVAEPWKWQPGWIYKMKTKT